MYGPSYISLEYGLQLHGLIPEQVRTITSVTTGRSRQFSTPVGDFSFRQISLASFASGMDIMQIESGSAFLVAVPEKALSDKTQSDRGSVVRSLNDAERYLVENLRIDREGLLSLHPERIEEYAILYRSKKLRLLADVIRQMKSCEAG